MRIIKGTIKELIEWVNKEEIMTLNDIAKSLNEEMDRAKTKFPWWPKDQIHAAAIVAEEAGELLKVALQNKYENGSLEKMKKEAIQTATMAIRFLENLSI